MIYMSYIAEVVCRLLRRAMATDEKQDDTGLHWPSVASAQEKTENIRGLSEGCARARPAGRSV